MSDTDVDKGVVEPPPATPSEQQDLEPNSEQQTMATDTAAAEEPQTQEQQQQGEEEETKAPATETLSNKFDKMNLSIWPPTQRTRNAVIDRLIQTLSTPSVLSKRYGSLSPDESSSAARLIEDEAFAIATAAFSTNDAGAGADDGDDDRGINILQIYSKEISKRMLEAVKAKAQASSGGGGGGEDKDSVKAEPAATSEEISSSSTTEPESTS